MSVSGRYLEPGVMRRPKAPPDKPAQTDKQKLGTYQDMEPVETCGNEKKAAVRAVSYPKRRLSIFNSLQKTEVIS